MDLVREKGIVDAAMIRSFERIVGPEYVLADRARLEDYSRDQTEDLHFLPDIVLKPRTATEISAIVKICNRYRIPLTPRGAGTGLSGGALAQLGGVLLSLERMNAILEIDDRNLQVATEPGVITEILQDAVKKFGLFYPPDPSSKGSCFIGGNIAESSGGPKAVKYGTVKDYVLNLEVVLASGEIIWTGANVLKNATGYNLTQLFVGSEGTLGIVTKIVLRLIPLPKYDLLMLVPFHSLDQASEAVAAIFRAGFTPSGLELMESDALKITGAWVGTSAQLQAENVAAHLLIELDGNHLSILQEEMESIALLLESFQTGELLLAEDSRQKEELWKIRKRVAEAVKLSGYTIEEDVVVPRAALPELIRFVKELGLEFGFQSVCYGHAGDGNLHVRIKKQGVRNSQDDPEMIRCLRKLFARVHELKGTISGEHGIGLVQRGFMDIVCSEPQLNLMRELKRVFDPNYILNRGKIFE